MPPNELFLEIGTEEIPSRFLPRAFGDLRRLAEEALKQARIEHGEVRTMGTPRRLVLVVSGVVEAQEASEERVMGPAKRVAFDESGKPLKAGAGFARSQGVPVESLEIVETEKGEYVSAIKKEEGRKTEDILPELLLAMIERLGFPKSMRWGEGELRFARPIHWIAALFSGRVIPFEFGGIASGEFSRGHRFMSPDEFAVGGFDNYLEQARERFVLVDPEERVAVIEQLSEAAAREAGAGVLRDDDLLEEVTGLVEYPTAVLGHIETEYLKLPREVLITAMKHHQRYFSVVDGKGALMPHFVAISNTRGEDLEIIRKGNERVLRARLADAEYFYREDTKRPLEEYVESLKNVIFQKDLGTSFKKVERIVALSQSIAERLAPDQKALTTRAAWLCKADLETQMIYEFPELQGTMGREYAKLSGEEETVCRAIDEHYRPRGADDGFPSDGSAAFVAIADKLDTIVGYVGLGKTPSGSEDPFGLRRAARGVLGTVLEHEYRLDLAEVIDVAAAPLEEILKKEIRADTWAFLASRLENLLLAEGFRVDLVRAAMEAKTGSRDIVRVRKQIIALSEISGQEDFEPLTTTFKRVMNIIPDGETPEVQEKLFKEKAEKSLHAAYRERGDKIRELLQAEHYAEALREIASLRPEVDLFFEDVLVMDKDEKLKNNRLGLLSAIGGLFSQVADFRKIVSN